MSFINLMENHIWSEEDIVNRTEAMAHAVLSVEEETILSRKVISALLGAWTMTEDDLATQARFAAACAVAHQAGVEARADMALLQAAMDVEQAQLRLQLAAEPAELAAIDAAERSAALAVLDKTTKEVMDLVSLRNPVVTQPKEVI